MAEPFASVLIPTRAPGPQIEQVLDAVFQQRPGFRFEVLIVDSGSPAVDLDLMRRFPVSMRTIPGHKFGHGRTRNLLATVARGEVLLYLSQDAQPASSSWMSTLVAPLSDSSVAGAYARQLPRSDADPFACFFLQETYGPHPARRQMRPGQRPRIGEIFFSNVSSAIRRDVWREIPFRDHVVMSEDQYWAHDVLTAGYEVVYEPAANVYHSHNYDLRSLFRRNWLSGASLSGLVHDSSPAMANGWLRYVGREIAFLERQRAVRLVPYALLYELDRAAAFSLGVGRGRIRPSHLGPLSATPRHARPESPTPCTPAFR